MSAFGMPGNVSALLFWGTQSVGQTPFGNGLLCMNGPFRRATVRQTNASGRTVWNQGPSSFGLAGPTISAGDEIAFQVWYRDPDALCAQGYNLTNGFRMTFTP